MPMAAFAEGEDGTKDSLWDISAEGDNSVTAYLSDDKATLTISGNGAMKDWTYGNWAPWISGSTNNTDITKVVISDGVTNIGDWAFKKCPNITEVSIPDSVTRYGDSCFQDAKISGEVKIGPNVTYFGSGIYANNATITAFNVDAQNTEYKSVDGILYTADGKTLVAYPNGKQATFSNDWLNGVEIVADSAFRYAYNFCVIVYIQSYVSFIGFFFF